MDPLVPDNETNRLDALHRYNVLHTFSELGYRLSTANTPEEAARTIVEAALVLLRWDACSLDLYFSDTDEVRPVLSMDTIDNQRVKVNHAYTGTTPSPMARKTLQEGGQLLLRDVGATAQLSDGLIPFGDVNRSSASLLFVPVRSGVRTVGVLSVQSYTPNAYADADLITLQGLADHCGGTFERILVGQKLRRREEEERRAGEQLAALLAVSNELSKSSSLEDLCRRAVELGRSQLGFDRLGIWFLTDQPGMARGSFGVDEAGEIRDERACLISTDFAAEIALMLSRRKPYLFNEEGPVYDGRAEVVGMGYHAMAPLWDGEKAIGYISTDNLLRRQPITRRECEFLSLYAVTLGHLCLRVRKEAELRQSEERFRLAAEALRKEKRFADTAIDSLPGIFYFIDRQGRILRWNRNCEIVSGYSAAEIAEMHPLDFFPVDDRKFIASLIVKVFEDGEAAGEAELLSKDGKRTAFFFTGQQTIFDGISYLVGTGIDISERKHLEEQLLQSQKMEGIGRLAGGIAHDFNNLLTAILGYADLSKDELSNTHPAYSYLENVCIAAERAATLTSQLLTFARKQITSPNIIRINSVVMDTGTILRRLIGEDVELIILPGPDLWLVKADASQLSQVLINLAVNARDAMPTGGKLTIETANINLGTDYTRAHADVVPGEYMMLAVSDTGVGMEAAVQQHIFEPFFTTKGVGKGTGLGLAMCYGIVKQSGGHIWLYSESGQGTTFKIYLPRVLAEAEKPTRSVEETSDWRGTETILLVEDEPLVLDFAARALRGRGYTVLEATNGHEALRIAAEYVERLDMVVTDVIMPQMSGKALVENLHKKFPSVRILYASGYTDNSVVHHGVLEADVAFLQKPYLPTMLARKVREVLDTR